MRGLFAVWKKELLEIVSDRHARRGGLVQAGVYILVLGLLIPSSGGALWLADDPSAIFFFALLPGLAAASVAADAFAGERERHTLETLLVTPLSERTILAGKSAAAVTFALAIAALGFVGAVVTVNLGHGAFVPSALMGLTAAGGAFASALLLSSVAIVVSMKVPVARATQQITSIGSLVIFFTGVGAWKAMRIVGTFATALSTEACVVLAALVLLEAARLMFRRERFFEERG